MTRLAAIDVGTNTVRLLVSDVTDGVLDVQRGLEITRLGRGVDASGRLDPDSLQRTVAQVRRYAEESRELGAERVRIAATSAVRDAANGREFADAVLESTGVEIEILGGGEEGRLAFLGATLGLDGGPFCVVDIGGGSTEFIRGLQEAESIMSIDIGSVRLRERCLSSDPPTTGEIDRARALVDGALTKAERHIGLVGDETFVGVAGTITTLASLVLGLQVYDPGKVHHSRLNAADVHDWTQRLLAMPVAEVRDLPAMQPGRADVIASGALIWDRVMNRWGVSEALVSEADILVGLVADMAGLGPIPR